MKNPKKKSSEAKKTEKLSKIDEKESFQKENIEDIEMTPEMEEYEAETGKYAKWRGVLTEGFKKWKEGEKVYDRDKERISLYINDKTKSIWHEFKEKHNYPTISRLIRDSVNYFIEKKLSPANQSLLRMEPQTKSNISHALKEPLTTIKGFSQLLLENYKEQLNEEVLSTIKNIFDQSVLLENKIVTILDEIKSEAHDYDVLLIEDDLPTIRLITSFFGTKGIICKGVISGTKGLEELKNSTPKVILLDIILPDVSGYDLCKQIKNDDNLKDILVYYLTAIPETEVETRLKETGADGYIMKPFDFSDFDIIFEKIKSQ
jgi:CheY-like chemotaxis protein